MCLMEFLNQPFILGVLGSYVFARLSERRAQREKTREKAVEFVTEVADDVNALFARIFAHIRGGSPHSPELAKLLGQRLQILFEKRLSVQVKSRAYLDGNDLFNDYERVIWAARYIVEQIRAAERGHDALAGAWRAVWDDRRLWPFEAGDLPRSDHRGRQGGVPPAGGKRRRGDPQPRPRRGAQAAGHGG